MSGDKQSVLVIIPAWNEASALPVLLSELREANLGVDILVVDDGSSDNTYAVARSFGVNALRLPLNCGVGGAIRTGYRYAVDYGYDYAVQVDADGQHPPQAIPALLSCMEETGADIVIGARFAGSGDYSVRGPRAWAMKVLARILSWQHKTQLTDTTSGFKLMNKKAFTYFSQNLPTEYLGDTIEALVIAGKNGFHVRQVPVSMRERVAGVPSHNAIKSAVFLARAAIAMLVAFTRKKDIKDV